MDEICSAVSQVECDVLVIGGGTAGPMAAIRAKQKKPSANVILIEKANVKRSGAIAMGMDGLNNAVIPGYATPEQYTKEITIANDGIVDQAAVYKYATNCFSMIQELDRFGIRFQKNQNGDYDVKKVHHIGTYVLPMPNGGTVKKALYRQLRREHVLISNRFMATRLLTGRDGRVAGAICVNTRIGGISGAPRQGGDLVPRRRRPARPADIRLSVRHLRERRQFRRRLRDGLSCRRGTCEPRMLSDQSADQGL